MDRLTCSLEAKVVGQDGRPIGVLADWVEDHGNLLLVILLDATQQVVRIPAAQIDAIRSSRDVIALSIVMEHHPWRERLSAVHRLLGHRRHGVPRHLDVQR